MSQRRSLRGPAGEGGAAAHKNSSSQRKLGSILIFDLGHKSKMDPSFRWDDEVFFAATKTETALTSRFRPAQYLHGAVALAVFLYRFVYR